MAMSKAEAENIVKSLAGYAKLDNRGVSDEVSWIALRYSCSRAKAQKMIEQARAKVGA